jgi:hypothetical protein
LRKGDSAELELPARSAEASHEEHEGQKKKADHGPARPTDQKEEPNHCYGFRAAGPPAAENGSELNLRMVGGLRRARKNLRHPLLELACAWFVLLCGVALYA